MRCPNCFDELGVHIEMKYIRNTSGEAPYHKCPRCKVTLGLLGEILITGESPSPMISKGFFRPIPVSPGEDCSCPDFEDGGCNDGDCPYKPGAIT